MIEFEHRQVRRILYAEYMANTDWNIYRAWKIQAIGMFESHQLN